MPMRSKDAGLYVFFGALALTLIAMAIGLRYANRSYLASVSLQERNRLAKLAESGLLVVPVLEKIQGALDPLGKLWETTPGMAVPLLLQNVTMPVLEQASVDSVRVQGLTDGRWIAWRLSWPDANPDLNVDAARFTDAAAIQFPVSENASFMMGGPAMKVQILQWKALWQKDVDEHFQDVQDLHPNYWADLYWFAEGGPPYEVPGSFADQRSHAWFPAHEAGNPMAKWDRTQPVEELVAEGFGTLSAQDQSVTQGRGAWQAGRWAVVFARPMATPDPLDYQFRVGAAGQIGAAVWNGDAGNVGGRKHYSNWVSFRVGS